MSGATEVLINSQTVEAQITATGVNVTLAPGIVTQTIIGVPGPDGSAGADGAPGAKGDPGSGVPAGGAAGQVPVKQSGVDYDLAWPGNFKIDPATGNLGLGVDPSTTTTRLDVKAVNSDAYNGYALRLKNSNGQNLFTVANDGFTQTVGAGLQVYPNGQASLGGLDFKLVGSTTYLNAYSSVSDRTVQLYNSTASYKANLLLADGLLQVKGAGDSYFLGNLGVGTQTPSTSLHVNGPARVGSYTVATVPSATSAGAGAMIYVSDESGGAVMAFSDGTNWRRMTDRAIIS